MSTRIGIKQNGNIVKASATVNAVPKMTRSD